VLALAAPAAAQCGMPDGLNGPCCAIVTANLPSLPAINVPGTTICYDNCNPQPKDCARVELAAPVPVGCATFDLPIKVSDCGGLPIVGSTLRLDYTRTWSESTAAGAVDRQVWRFVAKGDVSLGSTGPAPACAKPTCLQSYTTAFYYGYVDYALDCATGLWETAGMLFHACDFFIHQQGLSDKPGTWHPGRSYAIVWPDTSANPFVPGAFSMPGGFVMSEAMRETGLGLTPPACMAEEPIVQGSLIPLGSACLCPFALLPPQLTASVLSGTGACIDPTGVPGSFATLNAFPTTPWFHMMSHSIGAWTTGASYPGPERIWADEGLFLYHDPCPTVPGTVEDWSEIHYGATTQGGYPVFSVDPTQVLSQRFVDLASNFTHLIGSGTITPPVLGSKKSSRHLIYVNMF
jgi:hypothetical protein